MTDLIKTIKKDNQKVVTVYKDFSYQATSWDKTRRIVTKIEQYPDELFPRVGFIVISLKWCDKKVVKFYNKRGTCEQCHARGRSASGGDKGRQVCFVMPEADPPLAETGRDYPVRDLWRMKRD